MKYYLSADMEGIAGLATWRQCYAPPGGSLPHSALARFHDEVNAVITLIVAQDPEAVVVVNDAHSQMTQLSLASLHPQASLISGKPKRGGMMAGLDATFDAALLVGYHAKAGTACACMAHSFHDKVADIRLNGQSVGEAELNTLYANVVHQVPVWLVSGDATFCEQYAAFAPEVARVETKRALSHTAVETPPWAVVQSRYQAALRQSAASVPRLLSFDAPYVLDIDWQNPLCADVVCLSPWYTRVSGLTTRVETTDFETAYQALQSAYTAMASLTAIESA